MGKKKRSEPPKIEVTPEHYAALLARGGMASLDVLARFEEQVHADPDRWATPFGATQEQMLESVAALRGLMIAETLNASVAAATGV